MTSASVGENTGGYSPPVPSERRAGKISCRFTNAERRVAAVEDMIKRILDMDKKAQEITEAAQKEKRAALEEIGRRAEGLKVEYLDRARRRIQINAEIEQTLLEQAWRRREESYRKQTARLDALYAEKRGDWVRTIVENVKAN